MLQRLLETARNWPTVLRCRLGWSRGDMTYRLRSGLTLTSRRFAVDGTTFEKVWLERAYDPQEHGIPFSWSKAKRIVDCGAHIGMFTLYAAQKSSRAKIVALEPDTANLRMLQKNIAANNLEKRVTPQSVGLGNGKPTTLYTLPHDGDGHSVYKKNEDCIPMTIRTATLSEIFTTCDVDVCDLLKLSCEGAEYEALYALDEQDLKKIRCIAVECHAYSNDPTHTPERLEQFLVNNGFRTYRVNGKLMFATHA